MSNEENKSETESKIIIDTPFIKLDSFLKFCGVAVTGAEAKELVLEGKVEVNGEKCMMRGKKLYNDDTVKVFNECYKVVSRADSGD